MRGGRVQKRTGGSKAARFKPRDAATAPGLQLVVYELLSLLRESAEPQLRERYIALQTRIQLLASETDVAQLLAEEDGEPVEPDEETLR